MPDRPNISYLLNKPPEEIINWFKDKGYAVSWNWREVQKEMHSRAFTVAKAMDKDVLTTIRGRVEGALENGTTLRQFQKDLEPELKKLGWWGKKEVVDPVTGEVTEVQLGSPWRLKTIYRTNMQTSYMRGRYQHQKKAFARRPWLMYDAVNDSNTRPKHAAHDNEVRRHDDPFWDLYYPPNGWGCRCIARTLSDRQVKDRGITPKEGLPDTPFAGEGWDYNPGKNFFQPNLDQTWADIARQYVKNTLQGPGLGYMYQRTDDLIARVAKEKNRTPGQLLGAVRQQVTREEFPVGVLDDTYSKAIGADGHTVVLSSESLAKNMIRHPEVGLADYRRLQQVYEEAQLVVKESSKGLVFYYETGDDLFSSVKATIKGDNIYMTSFRKAGQQSVENIRKKGEILKDEL